jgi:hypothetical protein
LLAGSDSDCAAEGDEGDGESASDSDPEQWTRKLSAGYAEPSGSDDDVPQTDEDEEEKQRRTKESRFISSVPAETDSKRKKSKPRKL